MKVYKMSKAKKVEVEQEIVQEAQEEITEVIKETQPHVPRRG